MGKKREVLKVVLAAILYVSGLSIALLATAEAGHDDLEDCQSMQNENSRKICQKLARVELKVNRILQHLESGNTGGGHVYTPSYTCKISYGSNNNFEGYGLTVADAREDAIKFCTATGYSNSSCNQGFNGCDLDQYNQSGHFKCEVQVGHKIYQGLATNKKEARKMSLDVCGQAGYSRTSCLSAFKRCYNVQFN